MSTRLINRLDTTARDFDARLATLLAFESSRDAEIEATVGAILEDVRNRGDAAVLEYTQRFDRLSASSMSELELPATQMAAAFENLPADMRAALEQAAQRIRNYHERQRSESWQYTEADGTILGQQITPLDRVGLYVPGGKAAYPSSVLMNAIPAKVAGVGELIMVVPTPDGQSNALVLAAAHLAGVDRVFTIGGAQAVAALAYGTQTIAQVDKIVGPGNAYVAAAKRRVFGTVGIDMIAGPSEILIICDGKTEPDWIAMDLFSQAEHDELAQSILLSPDAAFLDAVERSIATLIETQPRQAVIRESLGARGALIKVRDLDQAVAIANRIAPEHLELSLENAHDWVAKIRHAGAIFVGPDTCEAVGDYCAGPNHVLPTSRTARFPRRSAFTTFKNAAVLLPFRAPARRRSARPPHYSPMVKAWLRTRSRRAIAVADMSSLDQLIRPEIRALRAYHVQNAIGMIKLDAMENPYALPESLRGEIARIAADAPYNRYPDASAEQLKSSLRATFSIADKHALVLGNGSDELIILLAMLMAKPGAAMLGVEPSFVMYRMIATFVGMRYASLDLGADFSLPRDALLQAIEREQPALIFLAYPNNPTGNSFSAADIETIVKNAPGLVVIDEAYHPFAQKTFLDRLPDYDNLLVMRTLSKLGLAGLRVGFVAGAANILDQLEKLRLPYNINVLSQRIAACVLDHYAAVEQQAAHIRADRAHLMAALAALDGVDCFTSETNFILIRVENADAIHEKLKKSRILIKNLNGSHALLHNCLRITVGTPDENRALVDALQCALTVN